jgi:hypothetical protein
MHHLLHSGNMKIITEVYMRVRPVYMDDWLSTNFVENKNMSEFEAEERHLERRVRAWNDFHYRRPLEDGGGDSGLQAEADGGEESGTDEASLAAAYAAGWLDNYFLHHALLVEGDDDDDDTNSNEQHTTAGEP